MLGRRDLNRTLLLRQHLLERAEISVPAMIEHLIGLQGQESLPPYLALAARIEGFDPHELSGALQARDAVRFLSLRGTIHVLAPNDALSLREWVQPALDRQHRTNAMSRPAREVPPKELVAATRRLLRAGPLPVKELGAQLAMIFPGVPAGPLAHSARELVPMVQVPPRGLWGRSGGVTYQTVDGYLGRTATMPDVRALVRRYLRAFGPATAADMTTWSGVTRLGPMFSAMREELMEVECEDGRKRYDVPDAPYADADTHAPVRLLGTYDNLWLSHAHRDHVVPEDVRGRWMGANGGVANTIFVDGFMSGLWWLRGGHVVTEVFQPLSRSEASELGAEIWRTEELLRR